jgi:hypothetical protein
MISTHAEEAFKKIQHAFMMKAVITLGRKVMFLSIVNIIYNKPIATIILNGEKLKPLAQKSQKETKYLLSILIQHGPGIPSNSSKTRNKRNLNSTGRSQTIPICRRHDFIPKRP